MATAKHNPGKRRAGYRLINVDGRPWQWICGRTMVSAYAMDDGEHRRSNAQKVGHLSYMEMQEDNWFISPGQVAEWLKKSVDIVPA